MGFSIGILLTVIGWGLAGGAFWGLITLPFTFEVGVIIGCSGLITLRRFRRKES